MAFGTSPILCNNMFNRRYLASWSMAALLLLGCTRQEVEEVEKKTPAETPYEVTSVTADGVAIDTGQAEFQSEQKTNLHVQYEVTENRRVGLSSVIELVVNVNGKDVIYQSASATAKRTGGPANRTGGQFVIQSDFTMPPVDSATDGELRISLGGDIIGSYPVKVNPPRS